MSVEKYKISDAMRGHFLCESINFLEFRQIKKVSIEINSNIQSYLNSLVCLLSRVSQGQHRIAFTNAIAKSDQLR